VTGPIPVCSAQSTEVSPTIGPVPTKHHPTPEERDERVGAPLDPKVFIEGVLAVDPDDEDGDAYGAATDRGGAP
jgi:hypothetical protein